MPMRSFLNAVLLGATLATGAPAATLEIPIPEPSTQYTFRTGDKIQYRIAEDPVKASNPMQVAVNTVGEASFPVCRDSDIRITLRVRGKTVGEVRSELTRRLLADYYNKATIELTLADKIITPGKVQFFGAMTASIPIQPDSPPLMLSDAMLQLHPSEYVDLRRVKVHRVDPVTQQSRVIAKDVRAILRSGKREEDIPLQDGDRVEVLEKWIN